MGLLRREEGSQAVLDYLANILKRQMNQDMLPIYMQELFIKMALEDKAPAAIKGLGELTINGFIDAELALHKLYEEIQKLPKNDGAALPWVEAAQKEVWQHYYRNCSFIEFNHELSKMSDVEDMRFFCLMFIHEKARLFMGQEEDPSYQVVIDVQQKLNPLIETVQKDKRKLTRNDILDMNKTFEKPGFQAIFDIIQKQINDLTISEENKKNILASLPMINPIIQKIGTDESDDEGSSKGEEEKKEIQ